jgi:hypothetical protein
VTDVPAPEAPTVFAPTGRPVVRFVVVLTGVAAVFAALWWCGLFAARVEVSVSERFDPATNSGIALVTVRNEGPLPVRVLPPRQAPRQGRYFEPPVRLSAPAPARQVRVDGGDTARFTVRYSVDCSGYDRARHTERGAVSPSLRLRLDVKGPMGTARPSTHDEIALAGACGDPIDVGEE